MTIKLYDLDAYQTTFEATVLSCTKREKDYDVILDQTLFFPEEGGQTCDQGTLNDVKVHDVQIIDQEIHHYVNDPLKGKIIGKIDFKHRYTNMQNHSGEHILSGLVKEMQVTHSPCITSNAALRASLNPPFGLWITLMRLSFLAYSSHISPHLSGEPSSTRRISKFLYV